MTNPLPLEVEVPEGPPVSQDPTWVPETFEDLLGLFPEEPDDSRS